MYRSIWNKYNSLDLSKSIVESINDSEGIFQLTEPLLAAVGAVEASKDYGKSLDLSDIMLNIAANPSDSQRTNLILNTFCFETESDSLASERFMNYPSINDDEKKIRKFVGKIISRSITISNTSSKSNPVGQILQQFEFLIGSKGVGKTHLQNYIISRYSKLFDRNRILWVRINLARDFGPDDKVDIKFWLKCQFVKILLKYYNTKLDKLDKYKQSMACDWRAHVFLEWRNSIAEMGPEIARDEYDRIRECYEKFVGDALGSELNPEWIDRFLVDIVYKHALENLKIRPVFIIDGIDLLDQTPLARTRYQHRVASVKKYLVDQHNDLSYSLVFMRPRTLMEFAPVSFEQRVRTSTHSFHDISRVLPVNISKLFKKRLQYLMASDRNVDLSTSEVNEFQSFFVNNIALDDSSSSRRETWSERVSQMSGNNARVATQMMSSLCFNYLTDRNQGSKDIHGGYRFIERTMLGRRPFPVRPFFYRSTPSGELETHVDPLGHVYDTVFVPSIFTFPYDANSSTCDVYNKYGLASILIAFRTLQLMDILDRGSTWIKLQDLEIAIEQIFKYESDIIYLVLQELVESELVDIRSMDATFENFHLAHFEGRLSQKGRRLLGSFICDISYLALAFFNLPLSKRFCTNDGMVSSAILTASPVSSSLDRWIEVKVLNGLSMLRLVVLANDMQKKNMSDQLEKLMKQPECLSGSFSKDVLQLLADDGGPLIGRVKDIEDLVIRSASNALQGFGDKKLIQKVLAARY